MYYGKVRQSKTWPELELQNVAAFLDIESAIDLFLNWQAMAIPAEAAGDGVLDSAGKDVAVVRESGGKRQPIVENILRQVFGPFELSLEGLDLHPEAKDFLLVFREGEVFAFTYFFHYGGGAV